MYECFVTDSGVIEADVEAFSDRGTLLPDVVI
jgi:hypothetical protein